MSTSTSLKKNRKTPGVYITEVAAFSPSVVGVATAVPIFIGYTETAVDPSSNQQVYLRAIPLTSMADYSSYFGNGFDARGAVTEVPLLPPSSGNSAPPTHYDFQAVSSSGAEFSTDSAAPTMNHYSVDTSASLSGTVSSGPQFNLYTAMQLFFANGGGNCFVISVGNYWGEQSVTPTPDSPACAISKDALLAGLAVSNDTLGGTMLVVPDACLLLTHPASGASAYTYPDYGAVVVEMLRQAGTLQDRVAILDLPGALLPANWSVAGMEQQAAAFYTAISPAAAYFSYGAAYAPALETSLLSPSDLDYGQLCGTPDSATLINNLLTTQALALHPPTKAVTSATPAHTTYTFSPSFIHLAAHIAAAFPAAGPYTAVAGLDANDTFLASVPNPAAAPRPPLLVSKPGMDLYPVPADAAGKRALNQTLQNALPLLGQMQQILAGKLNVVPPSGIMAGVWAQNDATRGVWHAPANIALQDVSAPELVLGDAQIGKYNAPANGNAVNALRAMLNRGTVVWGARTLDGNSQDYRYIQAIRTRIYIEQSIKAALPQFVFDANDGATWATVTATISNFLNQFWQSGGLMGDKPSDAFTVECGVPTTMSAQDVLDGRMIVNVTAQLTYPSAFIELTFTQTMQGV